MLQRIGSVVIKALQVFIVKNKYKFSFNKIIILLHSFGLIFFAELLSNIEKNNLSFGRHVTLFIYQF